MSVSKSGVSRSKNPSSAVHITYECIPQIRNRESDSFRYEVACSVSYPVASSHLSIRVTGQQTYRNAAARDIAFTRHETGSTTYVELLEDEHLEVRVVDQDGSYAKVFYYAHGRELIDQHARGILSTIKRIDPAAEGPDKR